MSDDKDDIEDDLQLEEFDDSGFDDFSQKGTLGDLWRNNPMVKVGTILAAFAFIVGGIILFGGSDKQPPASRLAETSDITEAPGTNEVSEAYRKAVEEENQRRAEQALKTADSTVPMPVEPAKGTLPLQVDQGDEEDPLERWRRMQEDRIRQQQIMARDVAPEEPEEPKVDTRTPAVNALAQAMSVQMEAVLQNQQIKTPQIKNVATMRYLEDLAEKERKLREERMAQLLQQQQAQQQLQGPTNILIPAGTIEYAQLITEANTDAPGPILAQLASGPLKGARMIGTFQSTEKYLTLNFNTVVVDGVSTGTSAVAIDPNTTLPGMVTDIDRRYFSRIVLPMASAFVEGLTEAIAESGRTSITVNGTTGTSTTQSSGTTDNRQEVASGIQEAGSAFSEILDEETDKIQPMLKIRAGTPIGILFVQPVIEGQIPTEQQAQQPQQPQQNQPVYLQPTGFTAIQPFLAGQQ